MQELKKVYVIGQYRAKDTAGIERNIDLAKKVARNLWGAGFATLCPHANSGLFDGVTTDSVFLDGDLVWLRHTDYAVVLPNYENSEGSLREMAYCCLWNIPILFAVELPGFNPSEKKWRYAAPKYIMNKFFEDSFLYKTDRDALSLDEFECFPLSISDEKRLARSFWFIEWMRWRFRRGVWFNIVDCENNIDSQIAEIIKKTKPFAETAVDYRKWDIEFFALLYEDEKISELREGNKLVYLENKRIFESNWRTRKFTTWIDEFSESDFVDSADGSGDFGNSEDDPRDNIGNDKNNVVSIKKKHDSIHDPVKSPSHYTSGGIEPLTFIESQGWSDFHRGNVIKYVSRAGKKGGPDKEIEDLEKAAEYLRRLIETRKKEIAKSKEVAEREDAANSQKCA